MQNTRLTLIMMLRDYFYFHYGIFWIIGILCVSFFVLLLLWQRTLSALRHSEKRCDHHLKNKDDPEIYQRNEVALRQSKNLLNQDALDSISMHIIVLDANGVITLVNTAWQRFIEQISDANACCQIGSHYLSFCPHMVADKQHTAMRAVLRGIRLVLDCAPTPFHLEYPCNLLTKPHWFAIHIFPLSGSHQGTVITHQDITPRKQTEKILRQYQQMISAIPDSIALLDRQYIYRVVNEEYLRRTGKSYEAIIDHSVAELMGEEIFKNVLKEKLDRCLAGDVVHYQQWFTAPNKDRLFLDVTYSPYQDEQGLITGIVVILGSAPLLN